MSDRTTDDDADRVLADCLEDFHRRRALAEAPRIEDYAERAGDRIDELRRIVETEERMDAALGEEPAPATGFPRPFGEYTLTRELGRGAMGVVYEAVHRPLGRTVALKVLRTGLDTEAVALERFRREARACAQVRHPHIVEVYDAGEVEGQPFYSMAILRGRALQELAGTAAQPAPEVLLRGFAGIADALGALHRAGIIHRDVKPSNILVAPDGSMILSDFGLARTAQSERMTATGQVLGTPLYMSPEQLLGRASEIDGRADVYGLGAAMYEVFLGRPLFRLDDIASAMRMILREQPDRPRSVRPDLPEELENILLKCTEKRKEDRYQDASALRDDLLALAEGRRVVGRPVSELQHGMRRARRYLPAAAAGFVLAIAGGFWALNRDATVIVTCWPTAHLEIDGVPVGEPSTAFAVKVAPGRHELTLRQTGFAPRTESFEVGPGDEYPVNRVIVAQPGEYDTALERIGRDLEVAMVKLEPLSSERGADEPAVRLLWPCGDLLLDDVTTWRVDVTEAFEGKGRIVFEHAGRVIAEEAFEPSHLVTERPVPSSVRIGLEPGARVVWSFVPDRGAPVSAEFTVAAKDVHDRIARIAERTREQPAPVAAHVRAQALLDGGLCLPAYREARALAQASPDDRRAWLVMQHALDGMRLRSSAPWVEVCHAVAKPAGR